MTIRVRPGQIFEYVSNEHDDRHDQHLIFLALQERWHDDQSISCLVMSIGKNLSLPWWPGSIVKLNATFKSSRRIL